MTNKKKAVCVNNYSQLIKNCQQTAIDDDPEKCQNQHFDNVPIYKRILNHRTTSTKTSWSRIARTNF